MVTIRTCKVFSHALGEYLRQADYYSQGVNIPGASPGAFDQTTQNYSDRREARTKTHSADQGEASFAVSDPKRMKVEGRCYGKFCESVGLKVGAEISDEEFQRVASNHHAATDKQLTERMAATRRVGYDATFNAPKSVSIQAFIGGDDRLVVAHETAGAEALSELETFATHQAGRGIDKRYAASGRIAAAVIRHGESCVLDPHLLSHTFEFNVTADTGGPRLPGLESSPIFERARYLTEVYRNTLAREVQTLGYAVERREHGFELPEISSNLLERFSKRAQQRDVAIKSREAELRARALS